VVTAYVLADIGSLTATDTWSEGAWSDYRGHPTAVAIYEGRLCWAGLDKIWCSVSDDYNNHNPDYVGDAGPIARGIGEGPVESIRWLVSSGALIAGGDAAEFRARSSGNDEPISPTLFSVKKVTTVGSHTTDSEAVDSSIIFTDASGIRLRELSPNGDGYTATDLTLLSPEICLPAVVDFAVQRQPGTRIHVVRSDGLVALLVSSPTEDVRAWCLVETDGDIEEVFVVPGAVEDAVYYVIARTINTATVRYLEKWALESECVGGLANKQADSFLHYSGVQTYTISGLAHLEGESCVVWADGVDVGLHTVTGGVITLTNATSEAVVGLPYTAQFKSVRLALTGAQMVSRSRIARLGVLLANSHAQGLQYGPDFDTLDDLPDIEAGVIVDATGTWSSYNYEYFSFNGSHTVDSRLCLQAAAPRPCTVLAVVMQLDRSG
jgi:hypothetical protein